MLAIFLFVQLPDAIAYAYYLSVAGAVLYSIESVDLVHSDGSSVELSSDGMSERVPGLRTVQGSVADPFRHPRGLPLNKKSSGESK